MSPKKETPQPLWAACSSAVTLKVKRFFIQVELPVLQFVLVASHYCKELGCILLPHHLALKISAYLNADAERP